MAQTTSTTVANRLFTEILGREALQEARPRMIAGQHVNRYDISGRGSKTLKLNRYTDIGDATQATEGTTFSTVTTLDYETPVTSVPTEAAVMLAQITDDAVELEGRFESVNDVLQYGTLQQQLRILRMPAARLARAAAAKMEVDMVAEYGNVTNSVGTTNTAFTLANYESAMYTLDTEEPNDRDYVFVGSPRQLSDIKSEIHITSGGVDGVTWARENQNTKQRANGYYTDILGVPFFSYDASAQLDSGATDAVGCMFVRGFGAPELNGGGQPGAFFFTLGRRMDFRVDYILRDRATDIMVNAKYDTGLRVDVWACKAVTRK